MSEKDNRELIDALDQIEREKEISKAILLEAIENSLLAACKNHFGKADNIKVIIDKETGEVKVFAQKEIVENVTDSTQQISLEQANQFFPGNELGDVVNVVVKFDIVT